MTTVMQNLTVKEPNRIVIKIGSSLLCDSKNNIDFKFLQDISHQVSCLVKYKKEAVIVSSGAIALGMHALGLSQRPKKLHELQAAAAIGQNELMNTYCGFFKKALSDREILGAQVLLTWEDFNDRRRYLNAKNTLFALLRHNAVPVINENDTVSTDEIKFGDNDRLSALVASLISADLLVILSDVDGLLSKDRQTLIKVVDEITPKIRELACPSSKKACVGGMITKIEAAKIAVESGIPCVIANGSRKDILSLVLKEPSENGTLFLPKKGLAARDRWIAFASKPKGKIAVDDGAKKALLNRKSLLAVGIFGVDGQFQPADIVSIVDKQGDEFARGKISVGSKHLEKIKGSRFAKEIIHCDNIVIL